MRLSTPVDIPNYSIQLSHEDKFTLMGSCFAENIGERLSYHQFNVCQNPFGIVFNPISLSKGIHRIIENKPYTTDEIVQHNELWLSLDHHGRFSNLDKTTCLSNINESIEIAHHQLKKSTLLVVTFGTAWVYEKSDFGIVANCHKIPADQFTKRLLSVKEIKAAFESVLDALNKFNSELNVLFTVSPVRHSKDGMHENNLSKASLLLATNNLVAQQDNCNYFPAYEIVMDELRDYRFFNEDMVHPSKTAIKYIWEKFSTGLFNTQTIELNAEIGKIQSALEHKPFNETSKAHKQFIQNTKIIY